VATKRYALEAVGAGLDIKTLPGAFMVIYDIATEDRDAFRAEVGSRTGTEKLRLSEPPTSDRLSGSSPGRVMMRFLQRMVARTHSRRCRAMAGKRIGGGVGASELRRESFGRD
jgi:hypothetical protein